jgi:hypothetical protein
MAWTVNLIQGSSTLDLNDGTNFKTLISGMAISQDKPDVLKHMPDSGEGRFVRYEDGDRLASIPLRVMDGGNDSQDTLLNNIAELERWTKEAFRYEIDDNTNKVQLKIQRDGATNATVHTLKGGWKDDSAAHYSPDNVTRYDARPVMLYCMLTPYGEIETAITLQNDLASSPHFVEDSDADGLADGWNEQTGASVTPSINTTSYLMGGQSQQVACTAQNAGLYSDTVVNSGDDAVGYAWLRVTVGESVWCRLYDVDGASVIQGFVLDSTDSNSVSDRTIKDNAGNTWYRVSMSGSVLTTGNLSFGNQQAHLPRSLLTRHILN